MKRIALVVSALMVVAVTGCYDRSWVPLPAETPESPQPIVNQVWPLTSFDCNSDEAPQSSDVVTLPGGYWFGTLVDCASDTVQSVTAFVTEDGYFRVFGADGRLLSGKLDTFGDTFVGTGVDFAEAGTEYLSGRSTGLWVDGLVSERHAIEGRWGTEWGGRGYFSFDYRDTYHSTPSSIEELAAVWQAWYVPDQTNGVWTVEADGQFNGQDASGCVQSGQFDVINSLYNLYAVSLTVANCELAGNYSGIAAREPGDWGATWVLNVSVDDGIDRAIQMTMLY